MNPDTQKLIQDMHASYYRLYELADSMELIGGVSLPLIDEAKQSLNHAAGCLEDAMAVADSGTRPWKVPEVPCPVTSEDVIRAARFLHLRVIR